MFLRPPLRSIRGKLKGETPSLLPFSTSALKLWQTIPKYIGKGLRVVVAWLSFASQELLPGGHHLRFLPTAAAARLGVTQ